MLCKLADVNRQKRYFQQISYDIFTITLYNIRQFIDSFTTVIRNDLHMIISKIFPTTPQLLSPYLRKLECGPMPNVMVALPNIGGALCSIPKSLTDAHYLTAVQ